jgi:long-chain acyl-CoA synthetase
MLYERWRQLAREYRNEFALRDLARNEEWTFGQLAKLTEKAELPKEPIAYPHGSGAEFVLSVLKAWRLGQVVCPIDKGQTPPVIRSIPPGVVHLKLTSATTGAQKLVAFTAPQLMADAENIVPTMGLRSEWPNLGVISLAHSYGFSNLIMPLLLHGIPLILTPSALPEILRRTAKSAPDGLTVASIPALWRIWHDAHAITDKVRLAISAGAPLPLHLEQSVFATNGVKIHNFYGATECGGIAYDASTQPREDATCVGQGMQNVQLEVLPDSRLQVRSAAVAQSYWPRSSRDLGNGIFRTSDISEILEGSVFLRGRLGDRINVAGKKVFPETIERVLATHPAVAQCVVFGIHSRGLERSESVVACVAARKHVTEQTLRSFALTKLLAWQVPRYWWFVPEIKANQRGKIARTELRKRYLNRDA